MNGFPGEFGSGQILATFPATVLSREVGMMLPAKDIADVDVPSGNRRVVSGSAIAIRFPAELQGLREVALHVPAAVGTVVIDWARLLRFR